MTDGKPKSLKQGRTRLSARYLAALRAHLRRDDDYRAAGKPPIDYDDRAAREALVDALTRDGYALLGALDGERLPVPLAEAAALLATVLGQDLDAGTDGV